MTQIKHTSWVLSCKHQTMRETGQRMCLWVFHRAAVPCTAVALTTGKDGTESLGYLAELWQMKKRLRYGKVRESDSFVQTGDQLMIGFNLVLLG